MDRIMIRDGCRGAVKSVGWWSTEESMMKVLIAVKNAGIIDELMPFLCQHQFPNDTEFSVIQVAPPKPFNGLDLDLQRFIAAPGKDLVAAVVATIHETIPCARAHGSVVIGDPKEDIVRLAQEMQADLIIMGSHARTSSMRPFLRRASMAVHAAAPCSILILHTGKQAARRATDDLVHQKIS
jgi:nucleotide-binding universal stress UspA family protein